jgi:3-oxoacyl-[acyl-carrier protein] reductase
VALVTGVSRRAGIGFAIAKRLLEDGCSVFLHSWSEHDSEQPWGEDPGGVAAVLDALGGPSDRIAHMEADFTEAEAPRRVVTALSKRFGGIDVLVCNHARSAAGALTEVTAAELDRCWAVNARATVLLVQAFAEAHDATRPDGRVLLFTSGQYLSPMPGELPYAISKGAVHQMTLSLADALAERGITLNTIHPGPVDTGWASPELHDQVRQRFPLGRWGTPEDIAAIVSFLVSTESAWITGQVISAEGGFRR